MSNLQPAVEIELRSARMRSVLTHTLRPSRLDIEDESAQHAGHAGAQAAVETHYKIVIVSDMFTSRTRVERSRMVHSALASEFAAGLHAVSLSLHSPSEEKS